MTTANDNPVIDIESATVVRQGTTILHDVSWRVEKGQHWILLGPNGSGKTTLLKVLTGYEWASQGHVTVLGNRFGQCNLRKLRTQIGWASSSLESRFNPGHTGLEIVASGFDAALELYRPLTDPEWERVWSTLRLLHAGSFCRQPYRTMSQGEQQRIVIARAFVHNPRVLILDEPCAGLDPRQRQDLIDDLEHLVNCDDGPTLVYVTHHLEEIGPWITHALALKKGQVLASGPVRDVVTGTVMTNIFDRHCELTMSEGAYWLRMTRGTADD